MNMTVWMLTISSGTKTTETSLPLGMPSCVEGVPFSGVVPKRSCLPVTPVGCCTVGLPYWGHNLWAQFWDQDNGDLTAPGYTFLCGRCAIFRGSIRGLLCLWPRLGCCNGMPALLGSQSSSPGGTFSPPSFQSIDLGRSSGEQRNYPTDVVVKYLRITSSWIVRWTCPWKKKAVRNRSCRPIPL